MKQAASLGILGILVLGNLGGGAPLQPREPAKGAVEPFGQTSFVDGFEGRKRACVIAIGNGASYLGLYVFDRWGNCVAKDDTADTPMARDDLAVEWFPPETGSYIVEVRNFGPTINRFTIAIR
jgi:hypothetical protein